VLTKHGAGVQTLYIQARSGEDSATSVSPAINDSVRVDAIWVVRRIGEFVRVAVRRGNHGLLTFTDNEFAYTSQFARDPLETPVLSAATIKRSSLKASGRLDSASNVEIHVSHGGVFDHTRR